MSIYQDAQWLQPNLLSNIFDHSFPIQVTMFFFIEGASLLIPFCWPTLLPLVTVFHSHPISLVAYL